MREDAMPAQEGRREEQLAFSFLTAFVFVFWFCFVFVVFLLVSSVEGNLLQVGNFFWPFVWGRGARFLPMWQRLSLPRRTS